MVAPCRFATVTTTICSPVDFSCACNCWFKASRTGASIIWALSTTRPLNSGNCKSALAVSASVQSNSHRAPWKIRMPTSFVMKQGRALPHASTATPVGLLELHLRCLIGVLGGRFEVRAQRQVAVHQAMPEAAGKGADLGVVLFHAENEVTPRHTDAVFRAFQLGLQGQEVLVRLQVRVTLRDHHQATEGTGQLALGVLVLLELLGIVQGAGIDLDRGGSGARLDHRGQGFLLLFGIPLDR